MIGSGLKRGRCGVASMTISHGAITIDSRLLLADLALSRPATDQAPLNHCGRWEDQPHQQVATSRLEASPWRGLMVADEVGLGKTISAIIALRNLHSKGEAGGVLIAVPGALVGKWEAELAHRADLVAETPRSGAALADVLERIDAGEPRVVIASHGVLRRAETLRWLADRCPGLMMTIVDEAHHCRNPRSRLHDAVQLLALRSCRALLLTATPVNLGSDDLWVQLSLLAPDRWPDFQAFLRTMKPTGGLNRALEAISREPADMVEVRQEAIRLSHTGGMAEDPRIQRLRSVVDEVEDDVVDDETRRRIADILRSARPLNDLLVRTRRRDLDLRLAERRPVVLDVQLTEAEWRLYGAARRWSATLMRMRTEGDRPFDWASIMPERMASSCLPAYARHVLGRMREAARCLIETDDIDVAEDDLGNAEQRLLRRLGDYDGLIEAADALGDDDTKTAALVEWLESEKEDGEGELDGGVLLFSQFHATLNHLQRVLTRFGFACETLTGRTPLRDRDAIRERFRTGDFEVLLSSEVGSEGLDQQHCHRLVNFDLPWNPMRLEQRIGRLDRFGQQAERIDVVNLCVRGTIDAAILGRLLRRIRIFEESLGMIDPLLGRAVRTLARDEMRREAERPEGEAGHRRIEWRAEEEPTEQQLAEDGEAPPVERDGDEQRDGGLDGILRSRANWVRERALEEREWLGPDPGVRSLRERTIRERLDLPSGHMETWLQHRIGEVGGQMHPTGDARWMVSLPASAVEALVERVRDPTMFDRDQRGWAERCERMISAPPPHWFEVVLDRDGARERPDAVHLAPWHPLVRWLVEHGEPTPFAETEVGEVVVLRMRRPPHAASGAAWLAALEWRSEALNEIRIRRWMLLDDRFRPIDEQSRAPQAWLEDELAIHNLTHREEEDLRRAMESMCEVLHERERWALAPILEELRHSAEAAWTSRIDREIEQLHVAEARARHEGRPPDPRWVTMKRGLVRRLRAGLADRLGEIDRIEASHEARLCAPLLIRLEDR